jgi:NAD(P)-dependent dehydrogenase (short-subunit alcohol dehydrogenase family)
MNDLQQPQDSTGFLSSLYSLEGKVAIVTGGTGVLGGVMARGLARAGAKVVVLGRREGRAEALAAEITKTGGDALAAPADVLDRSQLETAHQTVLDRWGRIDILVNAAGGTTPEASVPVDKTIFDMPLDAMRDVIDLNLIGTLLPCLVFGLKMAEQGAGCIVNVSSLAVQRAVTRAVAYSAGKAAMENFTRWLAVEMALKFGGALRVNALAPGFFVGDQNRQLLLNEDGSLTQRGQRIIEHTPARRFGNPEELIGALIWLCSPSASFVNGSVVFIDGGVNAFSGI